MVKNIDDKRGYDLSLKGKMYSTFESCKNRITTITLFQLKKKYT